MRLLPEPKYWNLNNSYGLINSSTYTYKFLSEDLYIERRSDFQDVDVLVIETQLFD